MTSDDAADEPTGVLVRLVSDDDLDAAARAGLLGRLVASLGASARRAGAAAVTSGRWLTDQVVELAPHVPVRDLPTLRDHHHGQSGDDLAASLIDSAARTSAAVGVASGVLASLEFAAPPLLLSTPVQLAAETMIVVAVELKLVAELHEVYGRPAPGTRAVQAASYLGAWTRRRALDPFTTGGIGDALGVAARRQLRRRLVRRAGANAASVLPLFAGAAAGGSLNARETRRLGRRIAEDLSPSSATWAAR